VLLLVDLNRLAAAFGLLGLVVVAFFVQEVEDGLLLIFMSFVASG
jgi:hypothetical protein